MTRLLLALAVAFGLLVLAPSPAFACSCAMAPFEEQVERAGTVASGTVDWTATDSQVQTYKVDFDAVYKGSAAGSEKLTTSANEASCGLTDLDPGTRYLFFIDGRHPGAMAVGLCGGTVEFSEAVADKVVAVTGPPGEPLSTPGLEAKPEDSSTRTFLLVGGAVLLVALAAAVFAVRRRATAT